MTTLRFAWPCLLAAWLVGFAGNAAAAEAPAEPFKPVVGQQGRDVVWVPTPFELVEKMLDVAQVTPKDFVMDLGSGDGRNVIAAAKRGARALGVEYNPDMVELSRRTAEKEGVASRATFVQGDMYEADISRATVLALFLLTENLDKLASKFLDLKPGARIVANHFGITGWEADESGRIEGECMAWCTWLLYIVPAKAAGIWRTPDGELALEQRFQMLSGTLTSGGVAMPVSEGRLRGNRISFVAGGIRYSGIVDGDTITGAGGAWRARRAE